MFRVQTEIGMSPGTISGEDVIRLVPRLRLSSHGKEQLKAENDEQQT
jgi:hypothetical protein